MKTLKELLKSLGGKIPEKNRVYSVEHKASETVEYVVEALGELHKESAK